MLIRHSLDQGVSPKEVLGRLVRQQGLDRYGFFFVTDEGQPAPDGSGMASGYVVDDQDRTFFFVVDWSADQRDGVFTRWEQVAPRSDWGRSAEYRRARAAAGLSEG